MTATVNLTAENEALKRRIKQLEDEISFLRKHPSFAQGMRGETLALDMLGGGLTSKNAPHDLTLSDGRTVEVKFSALNAPHLKSSCRRWNWKNPLGWRDKGKSYDLLLLVGERDQRFPEQYREADAYVMFLVPYGSVVDIMSKADVDGGVINLTSNLTRHRSPKAILLVRHRVHPTDLVAQIGANAERTASYDLDASSPEESELRVLTKTSV